MTQVDSANTLTMGCNTKTNAGHAEIEICEQVQKLSLQQQPSIKSNGWTRKNLRHYSRYKKLYGERKYAQKHPDQPSRLLDLPPEIRNHIYHEHLFVGSIELSPKGDNVRGNRYAVKHHMRIYKRDISPRLKLLRVNKKVNLEAASVFYGENEFRFSSSHGHEILFAFCRTIGKRNTFFLRKIAEHAPWMGEYEDPTYYRDRPAHTNVTSWGNFKGVIGDMGLHEKGHSAWKFSIMRTLTRNDGGIAEYSLVLPDRFILRQFRDFTTDNVARSLLPRMKNSNVQISLIHLYSSSSLVQLTSDYERQQEYRKNLRDEALAKGWLLEEAEYDKFGNYELDAERDFWNIGEPELGIL